MCSWSSTSRKENTSAASSLGSIRYTSTFFSSSWSSMNSAISTSFISAMVSRSFRNCLEFKSSSRSSWSKFPIAILSASQSLRTDMANESSLSARRVHVRTHPAFSQVTTSTSPVHGLFTSFLCINLVINLRILSYHFWIVIVNQNIKKTVWVFLWGKICDKLFGKNCLEQW